MDFHCKGKFRFTLTEMQISDEVKVGEGESENYFFLSWNPRYTCEMLSDRYLSAQIWNEEEEDTRKSREPAVPIATPGGS